jgi:hypothetical protein
MADCKHGLKIRFAGERAVGASVARQYEVADGCGAVIFVVRDGRRVLTARQAAAQAARDLGTRRRRRGR